MLARFCGYTTLRNLRFIEPFFVLFLLQDLRLDYVVMGGVLAYTRTLTAILETPTGVAVDRYGRRRGLVVMFLVTALAFAVLGLASLQGWGLLAVLAGQSLYALGEALRSGTHKAVMLDYLDGRGERDQATAVIGLTRVFSKASTGVAALLGGVLLWQTADYAGLFWASSATCVLGAGLMLTYPRRLEGEWVRDAEAKQHADAKAREAPEVPSWWARFKGVFSGPGVLALVLASVAFETQTKLALAYLQPYLADETKRQGLAVLGAGALAIGAYTFVQGLAAGASSALSVPWQRRLGPRALSLAHLLGVACLAGCAMALYVGVLWPGLVALLALACLQNLRRPIFVAALNEVMDPYQRATTLSLESQLRGIVYAVAALGVGAVADRWGLGAAFALMAGLAAFSLIPPRRRVATEG